MQNNRDRNSNVELMRIFCMFLIVLHHYVVHGLNTAELVDTYSDFTDFISMWPRVAINYYLLITGYYSINKSWCGNKEAFGKAFRLWRVRWFYSLAISILFLTLGITNYSVKYGFSAIFPTITCRHNFITTFIVISALLPFLVKMLNMLNKKEFTMLLVLLTLIMSVWPTIMRYTSFPNENVYSYLSWMIYAVIVGGYFGRYVDHSGKERIIVLGGTLAALILVTIKYVLRIDLIHNDLLIQNDFWGLMIGVGILWSVTGKRIWSNSIVNSIASSMYGVILIHDDPLVRGYFYTGILHVDKIGTHSAFPVIVILHVILIFLVCIIIELVRKGIVALIIKIKREVLLEES